MDILRPCESGLKWMTTIYALVIFVIGFFVALQGFEFVETEVGKNILIALGIGFCILILYSLVLIGLRKMFFRLAEQQNTKGNILPKMDHAKFVHHKNSTVSGSGKAEI